MKTKETVRLGPQTEEHPPKEANWKTSKSRAFATAPNT